MAFKMTADGWFLLLHVAVTKPKKLDAQHVAMFTKTFGLADIPNLEKGRDGSVPTWQLIAAVGTEITGDEIYMQRGDLNAALAYVVSAIQTQAIKGYSFSNTPKPKKVEYASQTDVLKAMVNNGKATMRKTSTKQSPAKQTTRKKKK